jgi:cytoskeletal protein CcmA (bactofilin family)
MSNGQTIVIKGEISGNEDLTIVGRVEGRIHLEGRMLTLLAGSCIKGDIVAGSVVASGEVEGNISATACLEIRSTANIDGGLTAPSLLIADGALVNGTIEMPAQKQRAVA